MLYPCIECEKGTGQI